MLNCDDKNWFINQVPRPAPLQQPKWPFLLPCCFHLCFRNMLYCVLIQSYDKGVTFQIVNMPCTEGHFELLLIQWMWFVCLCYKGMQMFLIILCHYVQRFHWFSTCSCSFHWSGCGQAFIWATSSYGCSSSTSSLTACWWAHWLLYPFISIRTYVLFHSFNNHPVQLYLTWVTSHFTRRWFILLLV